jgi:hypothetical protein
MTEKSIVDINWHFNSRQWVALDLLDSKSCEVLLYGGAKGGGKTVEGVRWVYMQCEKLIEQFAIKETKNPISIAFMGRKQSVDFNKTTLETWKREIPESVYVINEQKKEIVIRQRLKIDFGGMDHRQDVKKFNSAEYAIIFIDQAEEISEDEVGMLQGTLRLKINDTELDYKILLTANPAACWLKTRIVKNANREKEKIYFVKALPSDNPDLPTNYIQTLERAFQHRPELLDAYLNGNWDQLEGADLVIQDNWIMASHTRAFYGAKKRKIIACDPARFGDDRTVIYVLEETQTIDEDIFGQKSADYTAGKIATMAHKHADADEVTPLIIIDADGLGGPIGDFLKSWGFNVKFVHSQSQAENPQQFVNLRAEMWWTVGRMYADGDIADSFIDDELDTELTVPKYKFVGSKIQIESKDEIKTPARYGRSPDKADCRVYGLYGLRFVTTEQRPSASTQLKKKKRRKPISAMGV